MLGDLEVIWIRFALDKLLAAGLYHLKEVQYDKYYSDHEQNMDPTAGAREPWTYVPTEKTEQP
jgi:hypothetical protein